MPQTELDFDVGAKIYGRLNFAARVPQYTFSMFEYVSKMQLLPHQIKWFFVETFHTTYTTYLRQNQSNLSTKQSNQDLCNNRAESALSSLWFPFVFLLLFQLICTSLTLNQHK